MAHTRPNPDRDRIRLLEAENDRLRGILLFLIERDPCAAKLIEDVGGGLRSLPIPCPLRKQKLEEYLKRR